MADEGAGNANAAQDLYGTGVRIGLYLQSLGLMLYKYSDRTRESYSKGLKLASGSISAAILSSWFVFAAEQAFSPCEAFIVVLMLGVLLFPANTAQISVQNFAEETLGLVTVLLANLGISAALLWLFCYLVVTLPELGTENVIFFFARVNLKGWFRWLALVYCAIDVVSVLVFSWRFVRLIKLSWDCRSRKTKRTDNSLSPEQHQEFDKNLERQIFKIMDWDKLTKWSFALEYIGWIWVVTVVELTLRWNHLEPASDLRVPGQLIPFITGVIILIDSLFTMEFERTINRVVDVCKPVPNLFKTTWFSKTPRQKQQLPNVNKPAMAQLIKACKETLWI
ncbi:hypothetical protein TWF506_008154 [Arthrobotrys conoides]|uniref:Uncharacterized protein n=1 Tax=Arthrobotrys conoides TaxID=74498 RepID=A0AAN8N8W7_9PEZI